MAQIDRPTFCKVQVEIPCLQSREHHVAVDLMAYANDRERALRASGNKDVRPHDL